MGRSLFPGEETVTHRLVNGGGSRRSLRQKLIERTINFLLPGNQIPFLNPSLSEL